MVNRLRRKARRRRYRRRSPQQACWRWPAACCCSSSRENRAEDNSWRSLRRKRDPQEALVFVQNAAPGGCLRGSVLLRIALDEGLVIGAGSQRRKFGFDFDVAYRETLLQCRV